MAGQAVACPVAHPVYRSLRSLAGAPLAVRQSLSQVVGGAGTLTT